MPILCGDMSNRRTLKCIRGEDFVVFRRQEEIFQDQQHQLFRIQPSIAKSHESQNKTFQICDLADLKMSLFKSIWNLLVCVYWNVIFIQFNTGIQLNLVTQNCCKSTR